MINSEGLVRHGGISMKELLFRSNLGIEFNRETCGGLCSVKVQTRRSKRAYTIAKYIFPNIDLFTSSPYLSWGNLNCCGGWAYDESYLFTAVQEGKKPYAGAAICLPVPGMTAEAKSKLLEIKATLPDNCAAGQENIRNERFFPLYICRKGCLKDFFDLERVLEDYSRMGISLNSKDRGEFFSLCDIELSQFSTGSPMDYSDTTTDAELIATGLLLGYPIESTASILLGD